MWGTKYALRKATVMRTKILSVTPINPLGVTAPLTSKGSQENGVNAMPCRRYNPSVFLPRRGKKPAPLTQGSREARSVRRSAKQYTRRSWLFVLRSVKFGFDFTVCLYSLHSSAIIMGYYISTLHFHIFLLFSISFLMKNIPPETAGYFFAKIILYGAIYTLSERKIATKETHQGCVFVQVKRRKRRDIFLRRFSPNHRGTKLRKSPLDSVYVQSYNYYVIILRFLTQRRIK